MKILIVQDRLRSGGTERQSVLLANAFAARGHDATLLTFRPGGVLAGTVAANVTRRVLQPLDLHADWFAPGLLPAARSAAPDVVLCMGRMANCYAGALQRHLPAAAVIATMRTGKKLPLLFRRSLHQVRHIVANSHDARATLVREQHVPAERIAVIYNSLVFPAAAIAMESSELRARHGATAGTFVMLCVAMMRQEKNQRELIEIVSALPAGRDWQLWLAGDGPARSACEQLVAAKGLRDRVRFLGFQRDPVALYAAANLAVHASWSEALSNFLIEAQAHGLPAVAYDAQGIRECFVPDHTGWAIARDDREGFRHAIARQMDSDTATKTDIATAARAYARSTFDPDRQVSAYLELFHQLRRFQPAPT